MTWKRFIGAAVPLLLLLLAAGGPATLGADDCPHPCGDLHWGQAWPLPGKMYLCSSIPCTGGFCCELVPKFPEAG